MILPDTSAWIDYLAGRDTRVVHDLDRALDSAGSVVVGDLILMEVLQGLRNETDVRRVGDLFAGLMQATLCGPRIARVAAANYRSLRRRGVTVRGSVDVIIATWCIETGAEIIHHDRDLGAMERHLGLRRYTPT